MRYVGCSPSKTPIVSGMSSGVLPVRRSFSPRNPNQRLKGHLETNLKSKKIKFLERVRDLFLQIGESFWGHGNHEVCYTC